MYGAAVLSTYVLKYGIGCGVGVGVGVGVDGTGFGYRVGASGCFRLGVGADVCRSVGLQVEVGVEIAGSVETKALSWYLWLVWLE